MSNPNDPAYPTMSRSGMTIRQQFVMAAMQGLCANPELSQLPFSRMSQWAVEQADYALAEEARTRAKA